MSREHRLETGGWGRGEGARVPRPRGWTSLQVLIISRGRPRSGAEASCRAIGWNRPPREDGSTIYARSQWRRGEDRPSEAQGLEDCRLLVALYVFPQTYDNLVAGDHTQRERI